MMKPSGAGPAIRAREDRSVPVVLAHARQFCLDAIQSLVPTDFDKCAAASFRVFRPCTGVEPCFAYGRPQHARRTCQAVSDVAVDRGRGRVVRMWCDLGNPTIGDSGKPWAPMAGCQVGFVVRHGVHVSVQISLFQGLARLALGVTPVSWTCHEMTLLQPDAVPKVQRQSEATRTLNNWHTVSNGVTIAS